MNTALKQPRAILLGICGGVAAYKAVDVASRLRKAGYSVHVAMTDAAREFVAPRTFAAVSGNPILDQLFPDTPAAGEAAYPHLYPATRAEAFILLPATANTLAKLAQGRGDDVVSTAALSLPENCIRIFCPAMNVEMWRQPIVQENVRALEARGWIRLGPDSGALACGMEGEGRMSEPEEIVARAQALLETPRSLAGRRVLILSGPTREHLDPVRFLGNPSSGKMGRALARAAVAAGAHVDFVSGPVPDDNLPRNAAISIHRVTSANEMLAAAQKLYARADLVLYAAAVADYRPREYSEQKRPKHTGTLLLELEATPDIAATLNAHKQSQQVAIGFALQTDADPAKATDKLHRKNFDAIVLNALDALGGDEGVYTWIEPHAGPNEWGALPKDSCAQRIIARAAAFLNNKEA
ncbi:MAG: bifunctional phosphopantothenoylcysteine decarboxylase/phosphopantothenate--cysteine ligase CoaBC [Kiritimatiellae bacterium]|nr:bifunctional phosphopantothenoylcysteine decarboxylase/phosphopantothenate--cysteine ligase CoaBC [Kiritimatiellia bacterium]